jgi:hypothetical protein
MKAQDIINNARTQLEDFIIFELKMVFMYIYHGKQPLAGYPWIIKSGDLVTTPSIGVSSPKTEDDELVYRDLVEIRVDDERNDVTFVVEGSIGVIELMTQYLTTDELADIANALEATWNHIIGRN